MNLSKNIGNHDSIIRVIIGAIIIFTGLYFENLVGLIGLIPIFTGVVGWCPAYRLFGIHNCPRDLEIEV